MKIELDRPLIVALDFPDAQQALAFADQVDPQRCRLKVGKELFTAAGPMILEALHQRGFSLFLDLKYHDIPNTAAQACLAAARQGVWMLNVHASGGPAMMTAVREALDRAQHKSLVIAVTVLTSMDAAQLAAVGVQGSPEQQVLRLARLAKDCGMDGVVASPLELRALRQAVAAPFLLVTPGVRPQGAALNDQQRVLGPAQALAAGADYLVLGRPITQAKDPQAALQSILLEMGAQHGS